MVVTSEGLASGQLSVQ